MSIGSGREETETLQTKTDFRFLGEEISSRISRAYCTTLLLCGEFQPAGEQLCRILFWKVEESEDAW